MSIDFSSIPDWLKGKLKLATLASGLTPVYKIETSKRLSSGTIGDKVLLNRLPLHIQIQESESGISGLFRSLTSQISLGKVLDFFSANNMKAEVLGLMIDEGLTNPYRFITNIIFQDQQIYRPTGNKWLSSELVSEGYPLRVTLGFLTPEGNFKQHPYGNTIRVPKRILPDYTGVVVAATKEVIGQGDRFQVTCFGFEYLWDKEDAGIFVVYPGEELRDVLVRLLLMWSTGSETWSVTAPLLRAIPILKAMGVVTPSTEKLRSLMEIRKSIQFRDIAKNVKVNVTQPTTLEDGVHLNEWGEPEQFMSFLDALHQIQDKDITGTQIFFDHHGRLAVQGRTGVFTDDIVLGKTPRTGRKRPRVHDCVIGSNNIHLEFNSDMESIASEIYVFYDHPYPLAREPTIVVPTRDQQKMLIEHAATSVVDYAVGKDETIKYYGRKFGTQNVYFYDRAEETDVGPFAQDFANSVAQRYKYWGMRGSSYMIQNPKIKVGDVLRTTDIRGNEGLGINFDAILDITKEASKAVKNLITSRFKKYDPTTVRKKDVRLALGELSDYFYIWKVRHYIGSNLFTTKVFFVKEPFSLIGTSNIYRIHMRQRRIRTAGEDQP